MIKAVKIPLELLEDRIIQELNAEERGAWLALLILAMMSADPGIVQLRRGVAYEKITLAKFLNVHHSSLSAILKKLEEEALIKVLEDGRIEIINFHQFLSKDQRYYLRKGKKKVEKKLTEKVEQKTKPAKTEEKEEQKIVTIPKPGPPVRNDYDKPQKIKKAQKDLPAFTEVLKEQRESPVRNKLDDVVIFAKQHAKYPFSVLPSHRKKLVEIYFEIKRQHRLEEDQILEVLKHAWMVYIKTGEKGEGFEADYVRKNRYNFAGFVNRWSWWVDARLAGLEYITSENNKKKSSYVAKEHKWGRLKNDEPF